MIRLTTIALSLTLCIISVSFSQSVRVRGQKKFKNLCIKANELMSSDLDSAYYCIEKATVIAKGAQFWDAYFLKGLIQYQKREYNNSVSSYTVALDYAKKSLVLYTKTNIANSLYEAGRLNEAKRLAEHVAKHDTSPYKYNILGVLAKIHGKQGRLDSSEYFFSKAINEIPQAHDKNGKVTAGFLVAQADMYTSFGKVNIAINMYKRSLNLQQTPYEYCEVYVNLAKCLLLRKNYKKARVYLERAFELKKMPQHCKVKALQVRLELEYELERYEKMRATCQALGSLIGTANISNDLRNEVAALIQKRLASVIETKDSQINRVVFGVVMLLPLSLLIRLLFSLRKGRQSAGKITVVKNLADEVALKKIHDDLNDVRLNGLL